MIRTALSSVLALAALSAGACLPCQAQTPTQVTAQQARKAQQNRNDAEAFLQREEAAATGSRNAATDRANRNAGVLDEASGGSTRAADSAGAPATAPTVPTADAPPPYGPVLNPRQPQSNDPSRRNPAEVHDEADTGANPAAQPQQGGRRNDPQASRHPAWQPAAEPMAPRASRRNGVDERATNANPEPVPAPAAAPRPVVPSSTPLNGCIGGTCTDAAGNRYNGLSGSGSGIGGSSNAGVSASGRLCNRSGATVQCF